MCLVGTIGVAQTGNGFGIKAGLNYGSTGELKENGRTIIENPEEELGYHFGVFGKLSQGPVYLRPEIQYTKLVNDYNGVEFDIRKIDVPVLIGFHLVGSLHVFAGPSLQYVLEADLGDTDLREVSDEFTFGGQVGFGLNFGHLGIDVRYERGFDENEVTFINNNFSNQISLDTRPEQIIIALSLKF